MNTPDGYAALVDPQATAADATTRKVAWVTIPLVLLVFLFGGGFQNLEGDEVRVAGIAAGMQAGQSSVAVPRLAGREFLEKPPLGFACVAASFRVLGTSSYAARLPGLVFGLVGALLLGVLAWDVYGSRAAALAAALGLLFNAEHFWVARKCVVDNALAAGVITSVVLFCRAVDRPRQRWLWLPLAASAVAVACLAKGAIGLVLPALAFAGVLAGRRSLGILKSGWFWICPLVVAAPLLLWLYAVYAEGGEAALRIVVVDNHLHRFSPSEDYLGGHQRPFWFYVGRLPAVLLPALVFLPASLRWHWARLEQQRIREVLWLSAGWLGLGFVILSLAGTKRVIYLLPIVAPAPLLAAGWLASLLEPRPLDRLEAWTLRALVAAVVLGAVGLPVALALGPDSPPVWSVAATAITLGAAGATALAYRSGPRAAFLLGAVLSGALIVAVALQVAGQVEERKNSEPRSFYEEVARRVPPGAQVRVFPASEHGLGAFTYYTGRVPETLWGTHDEAMRVNLERCRADLRAAKPLFVVVLDKQHRADVPPLWEQLREPGVHVLAQETRGRWTSTLLANRAATN
ncbi:MAG: glycosyltransferase family 39 protein [Planctomycetes bacterium]|nr:glycosyltransferase family 39 protein [Planctomycetota bacterium]